MRVRVGQFLPPDEGGERARLRGAGPQARTRALQQHHRARRAVEIGAERFRVVGVMEEKGSSSASIWTTPPTSR